MKDAVEQALTDLRPSLAADGFDLKIDSLTGDEVSVGLVAKPDACMDCLVPDDMLVQILETSIRKRYPALAGVVLTKHGF
jgi:Fe-S cluster biogenesis protein NfuA